MYSIQTFLTSLDNTKGLAESWTQTSSELGSTAWKNKKEHLIIQWRNQQLNDTTKGCQTWETM